jgi:hypothetical protein
MSRIIKEPLAPARRHFMIAYNQGRAPLASFSYSVKRSFIALPKLADAFARGRLYDPCFGLVVTYHSAFAIDRPVNCFLSI